MKFRTTTYDDGLELNVNIAFKKPSTTSSLITYQKKKKYLALSLTLKIFLSNTLNGSHPHLSTPLYTYLSCLNVGLLIINCEGEFLLKLNLDLFEVGWALGWLVGLKQ